MISTSRINTPTHAPMTTANEMLLPEEELGDEVVADGVDEEVNDGVGVD